MTSIHGSLVVFWASDCIVEILRCDGLKYNRSAMECGSVPPTNHGTPGIDKMITPNRGKDSSQANAPDELDHIIFQVYQALESGESINERNVIAENPRFASELASFFADLRHLQSEVSNHARRPNLAAVGKGNDQQVNLSELSLGSEFIRDYQLVRKLGEGGCGRVYLAMHTKLEKPVALKILNRDRIADPSAIDRFKREMIAVGRFKHDNIVQATEAGEVDGLHFLVMELIDGIDLSKVLRRCDYIRIPDVCAMMMQTAAGLQHVHQHDLIHRDVKPSNLMLTATGEIKLLDFGLVQFHRPTQSASDLTSDGQAVGTLRYMAPEQLRDPRRVTKACDYYSLGLTTLELIGGRNMEISNELDRQTALDRLSRDHPDMPAGLVELIRKLIEPEPSKRLAESDQVISQFAEWKTGSNLKSLYATVVNLQQHAESAPLVLTPPPFQARRENSSGFSLRSLWLSLAVLTTLSLLGVLAWIGIAALFPRSSVPASLGQVFVSIDGQPLSPSLSDPVALLIEKTTGEVLELRRGSNRVATGSYRLIADDWSTNGISEIAVESTSALRVTLSPQEPPEPDFPVQFPKIPQQAGAWVSYNANVTSALNPAGQTSSYRVELRTLELDPVAAENGQWLKIQVGNTQHEEAAYLRINASLYESEQALEIFEGWIEAAVPDSAQELKDIAGEKIYVRWNDRTDPLEELAEQWSFHWPADRMSCQSTLAILFDHQQPAAQSVIANMRIALGASANRLVKATDIQGPLGKISCLEISSSSESGQPSPKSAMQYTIVRSIDSDEVPFSYVSVDIHSTAMNASLKLNRYGFGGRTDRPSVAEFEKGVAKIADADVPTTHAFTHASLPENSGEYTRYSGGVRLGDGKKISFEVRVTSFEQVAIDERSYRWLELALTSGVAGSDESFSEAAYLLIDEDAYRDESRFEVKRGWLICANDVFDFGDGNDLAARESLAWLGNTSARAPFKVHQALTLLFDARLPASGFLSHLRSAISAAIIEASEQRSPHACVFQTRSGRSIPGYQWNITTPSVTYTICRSSRLPFGFGPASMHFGNSLDIFTEVSNFGAGGEHLVPAPDQLEKMAAATAERLEALRVRDWSFSYPVRSLRAQFERFEKGRVRLKALTQADAIPTDGIAFDDFSRVDQDWIMENAARIWKNREGGSLNALLQDYDRSRRDVSLLYLSPKSNEYTVYTISQSKLSAADQQFVEEHAANW